MVDYSTGQEKTDSQSSIAAAIGEISNAPRELEVLTAALLERNARDAVVLDLRGLSDAADFFVIASGDSDTHVRAIAENVARHMKEAGFPSSGTEGTRLARWILIDYINVVAHVFLPPVREFYKLETLWGDAPSTTLE
jgi:ribosome-associated protein